MIDKGLQELLEKELSSYSFPEQPENLFNPLSYFLKLGGKRLRPLLTLMGCRLFGGDPKDALQPALAIELFHNFSLIHDDIMDEAPLRRGQQTVHTKWDSNVAILSGDALLVEAYQKIGKVDSKILPKVLEVFSNTAMEVCQGQQYDMDFETIEIVPEEDYIKMIQYKTSVLLGCALQVGALIADADEMDAKKLYDFGLYMGTSFQIKDDLLDAFGDPLKFGKQIGGDIIANKKTLLLIKALDSAQGDELVELNNLLANNDLSDEQKVNDVKALYIKLQVDAYAKEQMDYYYNKAISQLESIDVSEENKKELFGFATWLHQRES